MARMPAYRTVYYDLKSAIKNEVYPVGSLLPTESELEKQYAVSRVTVRRAVSLLAAEGYVKATQGKGTQVLPFATTQKLGGISSITETLKSRGFTITTQDAYVELVPATAQVAMELQIKEGEPVYCLQRVQCANGVPCALMTNYLKVNLLPEFEKYVGSFTGLYSFLEEQYHIVFVDAVERLSAISASFTDAQILRIKVGHPLLCSKRTCNTTSGPFEYSVNKLVTDKYEYSVYLKGR